MKKLLLTLSLITMFAAAVANANGLTLFNAEIHAQNPCPNEVVVWLNTPTGIWHTKGARWYGRTKHGAYVCRDEAAAEGDRGSLNRS